MITVEIDSSRIQAELNRLLQRSGNLSPVLRAIGEKLTESTKKRFETYTGPDGVMWEANSDVTYERKADRSGIPLTDHGTLGSKTITYDLEGTDALLIGSTSEYAAMMQLGGTKDEFPHLWGNIPARPFLGISAEDGDNILDALSKYLQN
jgi:phage virion morphogenesis protein